MPPAGRGQGSVEDIKSQLSEVVDMGSEVTLYLSLAKRMEARWNLHRGFLGSMPIARLSVSSAASDFFRACCTCRVFFFEGWRVGTQSPLASALGAT